MNRLAPAILAVTIALAGCKEHTVPAKSQPPIQPPPVQPLTTQPVTGNTATPALPPPVKPQPPVETVKIPPAPPAVVNSFIATVNGVSISREQVTSPLLEARGLDMLMNVVQLELAKNEAAKLNLVATPQDVRTERSRTLEQLFKDQNSKLPNQINEAQAGHHDEEAARLKDQLDKDNLVLLEKLLQEQKASQAEFMIAMQTNANLRKVVDHQIQGKLTDEDLQKAFNAMYGENIHVRHIQCANLQEIAEAQRRLEAGQTFEKVALDLSRNTRTRDIGGELPKFSRQTTDLSDAFKQVAFSLKEPGEVSEPVSADGAYHLIKLIERIPPKAVKYDDVKDSVGKYVRERLSDQGVKELRANLGQIALQTLQINDPVLAKQFKDRLLKRQTEMRDRDQINRELERQREATTQMSPTTAPNQMPPQEAPNNAPQAARPPATRSGSFTPDPSSQLSKPTTQPQ